MESPAYVVTVLDSDIPSVRYPVHGADSADVLRDKKINKSLQTLFVYICSKKHVKQAVDVTRKIIN